MLDVTVRPKQPKACTLTGNKRGCELTAINRVTAEAAVGDDMLCNAL